MYLSAIDTPLSKGTETAVDLVEWAEKLSDTPADLKASFSQHAVVVGGTAGCGLLIDRNSWFPSLHVAECFSVKWYRT